MEKKSIESSALDIGTVQSRMFVIRGQQVLLDRDVAALYGVETRVINQAVKNNPEKFPAGYAVELSTDELSTLRSKFLTANVSSKSRAMPKVFTERGLYMLATILKGERAVRATLAIIETYARNLEKGELDASEAEGGETKSAADPPRFWHRRSDLFCQNGAARTLGLRLPSKQIFSADTHLQLWGG